MGKKNEQMQMKASIFHLVIIAKGLRDSKEKSIHCLNYVSTDMGVHMREREGGEIERERERAKGKETRGRKRERGVDEKNKNKENEFRSPQSPRPSS